MSSCNCRKKDCDTCYNRYKVHHIKKHKINSEHMVKAEVKGE